MSGGIESCHSLYHGSVVILQYQRIFQLAIYIVVSKEAGYLGHAHLLTAVYWVIEKVLSSTL